MNRDLPSSASSGSPFCCCCCSSLAQASAPIIQPISVQRVLGIQGLKMEHAPSRRRSSEAAVVVAVRRRPPRPPSPDMRGECKVESVDAVDKARGLPPSWAAAAYILRSTVGCR